MPPPGAWREAVHWEVDYRTVLAGEGGHALGDDPDGQGEVFATLVRRTWTEAEPARRAVLYVHGFSDYFFQTAMADFFAERGVKLMVVACNTTSAIALETLRARYPVPVVGVSEIIVHVAVPSDELRAVVNDASGRERSLEVLENTAVREIARRHEISLLGWADIRRFLQDS